MVRQIAIGMTLLAALLGPGCGIAPPLPDQIPDTGLIVDEGYAIQWKWDIPGVTEMVVHRGPGIFYVIQHDDSLRIYATYYRNNGTPPSKDLFQGLLSPRLLADGSDLAGPRIWVYDGGDDQLKGYDGGEFLNPIEVELSYQDERWQDPVALAADDESRVFVADRGANRIFRYRVEEGLEDLELERDGEVGWVSQQVGATVRDLSFGAGRLYMLDDGLKTVQILDPAGAADPIVGYIDDLLGQPTPTALVADADHIFVLDAAGPTVWELDADFDAEKVLRVNQGDGDILVEPRALTLNDGKLYVGDPGLEQVLDYERHQ
jgi:hypothetical protein